MACTSLENILKGCENNQGGIYTAYVFDMDDLTSIVEDVPTWNITAMVLATPALVFEFKRNTSDYTDEAQIDLVNGSTFYKKTLNLMFHRREAVKSKALKILGEGQRYLGVVVGDANGLYWYLNYMQLTVNGGGSGKTKADGSNYNVTLIGEDEFIAKTIDASVAIGLIS